ncbi:MAG: hypothetical protein FGM62_06275 [Methylobacterium sp.]|nr:hypothetical protein [Methylobacterium sp.]
MIPFEAWQQHEPRMNLPIFGNSLNEVDFSVQEDRKLNLRRVGSPLYHFAAGRKSFQAAWGNYKSMFLPSPFTFKAFFLNRQGELLCHGPLPGAYKAGDFFYLNVNDWLCNPPSY